MSSSKKRPASSSPQTRSKAKKLTSDSDVPVCNTNNRQQRRPDEPDVIVVVGGKEFQESSRHLRSFSDYFDAAFRSGMKESQEMRFEFPDNDPEEWEVVRDWLKPFSKIKNTKQYLKIALAWFDQLIVPAGLEKCDYLLIKVFLPKKLPLKTEGKKENDKPKINELDAIFEYFDLAVKYNLPDSLERCTVKIIGFFQEFPYSLKECHLNRIPSIMDVANENSRKKFLEFLIGYFPQDLSKKKDEDALLSNNLFGQMLYAQIQLKHRKDQLDAIVKIVDENANDETMRKFKNDKICGECFKHLL